MFKERKEEYLHIREQQVVLSNNISGAFYLAEKYEEQLGRDLSEWNSDEIISFYRYIGTKSIQTLIVIHNGLRSYTDWCISNGLVKDHQNHYREINTAALTQCIDSKLLEYQIVTRDYLLEEIKHLKNFVGQFIMLGLFEGIVAKDDVMKNVKLSDLDGNILHLSNGNDITISKELVHIMNMADEEDSWIKEGNTEHQGRALKYVEEDTIIKYYANQASYSSTRTIGSKLRSCIKVLDLPSNITIKNIQESGRIDFIKRFAKENGIKETDCITKKEYVQIHEKIYGFIQSKKVYMMTYGINLDGG